MATSWHPPVRPATSAQQHVGHVTSVDIAQKQKFSTRPVVGVKRILEDEAVQPVAARILQTLNEQPALANHITPYRLPVNKLQVSAITRVQPITENVDGEVSIVRSTPGPSQHPLLSLAHPRYGLPPQLIANFESLGVRAIYPWQSFCLLGRGLLDGQQNLIYTAPTGGGKSLVADILLVKRIIESSDKKAILVLPYVALVQEKTKWLRRVTEGVMKSMRNDLSSQASQHAWKVASTEIRVAGFFGGNKSRLSWSDCDIAVCTIEKANSLVNEAIEDGKIDQLGIVVLDELHLLDDEYRGYLMELMITKLITLQVSAQIIGMSATLPNPELLASWLHSKFYVSKYRPIPIQEHLVYNNSIYPTANSKEFFRTASQLSSTCSTQTPPCPSHTVAKSRHKELVNSVTNAVIALAIETALAGYGALVFCGSRQSVQTIAALVSEAVPSDSISADMLERRTDILASLQALPNGFESTFTQTILAGVGFHHAGLTIEERELVAEAYDAGILKVMVATCSLAAGINLPARRVIIHGARMGRDLVGPAMLRQMRGRAGRKGKDEIGETFLCCQKTELEAVAELLESELPAVVSCLTPEKRGVKRALLEVIATRVASSYESLQDYFKRSLLWHTVEHGVVLQMLDSALDSLLEDGLIQQITNQAYAPSTLGSAVVASSLTPEDGLFVHSDLRRALSNFVMDSEFHIFYLFTPIPQQSAGIALTSDMSWNIFRAQINRLDDSSLRALRLVGVSPAIVNQMVNSGLSGMKEDTASELQTARIYRRAYSAFALRDLCNEVPVHTISLRYELARGTIQNLAQTCHGFAAGMIKFCQRMAMPNPPPPAIYDFNTTITTLSVDPQSSGFSMLAAILEHMVDRLRASARADLLEMAQVTFVKGRMARLLYENGFKSIRALSEADPEKDIVPVMMIVSRWKAKPQKGETVEQVGTRKKLLEEKLLAKAEILVASASKLWEHECLRQLDEE